MNGFQSTLWSVILEAREGDAAALRSFVDDYQTAVVSFLKRRGFRDEAEDLGQEVFLRFHRDGILQSVDPGKGRFRSLVLAVTRNVVSEHLKRQGALKRGGDRSIVPLLGNELSPADEEDFDREWVRHLIERVLKRLAAAHPNYHDALRLFLEEGQSHAQVAESLGKSAGEVKNYIHRGKKKFVAWFREEVANTSLSPGVYEEELRYLASFLPSGAGG